MLNRKNPVTLATQLILSGQGVESTEDMVYHFRTTDDIKVKNDALKASEQGQADPEWADREMFLYVVKSINGETPTHASVKEMNIHFPGVAAQIFSAYNELRFVGVSKNWKPQ